MITATTAPVFVSVVAALATVAAALLTGRFATRQAKQAAESTENLERTKVEAEAFRRARETYNEALDEERERVERITTDLKDIRDRLTEGEAERDRLREYIRKLNADLSSLTAWSRGLLRAARAAGVQYREPPINLGGTDPDGFPPVDMGRSRG